MKRRITIAVILVAAQAANAGCEISKFGELPVTLLEGRAFVSATINGADAKFIVDSGAFFSSVTRGSADKFKLRLRSLPGQMQIQGIGGTAVAELTTVKAFSLPGLHGAPLKDVDFVVMGNRMAAEADGLLGENVLGFADTEYDLANSVIRLMRAKGCDKNVLAYWHSDSDFAVVEVAPRTAMEPHIVGSATLNGTKIKVMFDSGVAQSTLTLKAAARAGIKPSSDGVTPGGTYFGVGRNAVESWIAHFQGLNLGGEEIRNIGLRFADFSLSTDADMLIGLDFFKSHRIYVSKSQRRLYFTYNGGQVFDLSVSHAAESTEATNTAQPTDADGYNRRAAAFAARRQFDLAFADYDRAIELQPNDSKNFHDRGVTRLQNGQPVLAMGDFDHALQLNPTDPLTLILRGQLRLNNKDEPGATADFEEVVKLAPTDPSLTLKIARAYESNHQYATAIARLDHWIVDNAKDDRIPEALHARCWCRAALGVDLQLALADCDKAIARGDADSSTRVSRGLVRLRLGDFDKSITDFKEAVKLQPKNAWPQYGLALAELKKGDQGQGEADLKAAAILDTSIAARYKVLGLAP